MMQEQAIVDVIRHTHTDLVRLSRLAHTDARFKPLVFESLLHHPVYLAIASEPKPNGRGSYTVRPCLCRSPELGLPIQHALAFTSADAFQIFTDDAELNLTPYDQGQHLLNGMGYADVPLVLDVGSRHQIAFAQPEWTSWLKAWRETPPLDNPLVGSGGLFARISQPSQLLLDRLATYLMQFADVERAYLIDALVEDRPTLTLAVEGANAPTLYRILRAVPLLQWGLERVDAIAGFMPIYRSPDLSHQFEGAFAPVYDQSMHRCLRAPSRPIETPGIIPVAHPIPRPHPAPTSVPQRLVKRCAEFGRQVRRAWALNRERRWKH